MVFCSWARRRTGSLKLARNGWRLMRHSMLPVELMVLSIRRVIVVDGFGEGVMA